MQNLIQALAEAGALFSLSVIIEDEDETVDETVEYTYPPGGRCSIDHQLDVLIGLYLHGACVDLGYRVAGIVLHEDGSWDYGPVVEEGHLSDMLPQEGDLDDLT